MPINKKILFSGIAISLFLCLGQIVGNAALIFLCLISFLVLLGLSCVQQCTLPVLLYFLPWSPLMKLNPGSFSFYTFGLVMICCISIVKKGFSMKQYPLVAGILLTIVTLFSKLLDGSSISFDYIAFIMMIVLFPTVKEEYRAEKYDFYNTVVFLSLGIIIAALCAMQYAAYSNIARYIQVDSFKTIIRRSGFYGDPNFYTAHITAALGGCLVLLLREKKKPRILLVLLLLAVLIYCGFLSGSKSFVLVSLVMSCFWLLRLVQIKNQSGLKLLLLFSVVVLAVYISRSQLFSELLQVISTRFSDSSGDINRLTTGRTALWKNYISEIFGNVKVFFLGKGFSNVKLNGRGSHSTILQLFFQFGIVGVPILIYWIKGFMRNGTHNRDRNRSIDKYLPILLIGVFAPWLAIDVLYTDEFFLFQWYIQLASSKINTK